MLSNVSLVVLSRPRRDGLNIIVLGFTPKALKKLKGERFGLPSASMVLANAMGLGAMAPSIIL
jgi:hypothetical protein